MHVHANISASLCNIMLAYYSLFPVQIVQGVLPGVLLFLDVSARSEPSSGGGIS